MANLTANDAAAAVNILTDAAVDRENDIIQYNSTSETSGSDEKVYSSTPIIDAFVEASGSSAYLTMTNFSATEFGFLWNSIGSFAMQNRNVGRGRKSAFSAQDVLFMLLTTLKHGGQWDFLGKMFKIKGPTFERTVVNFLRIVVDKVFEQNVTGRSSVFPMSKMIRDGRTFQTHRYARYATDVTFQHTNKPSGNLQEGKAYFSGKHKMYGYKVEVSVLQNGIAIACSDHFPGATSDMGIMRHMLRKRHPNLRKCTDDCEIPDIGPHVERYGNSWALLANKGYQGTIEFVRAVSPRKKPAYGSLSREDEDYNKKLSSDRIIVEKIFGRLRQLWGVLSQKFRCGEALYDDLVHMCVALTNVHFHYHPLRCADKTFFNRLRARQLAIGDDSAKKRKRAQQRYREKRRRRIETTLRLTHDESESV